MNDPIGRNIRPGQTPGGMTKRLGRNQGERNRLRDSSRVIREAANVVLEKRGFVRNSDPMRENIDWDIRQRRREVAGAVGPV